MSDYDRIRQIIREEIQSVLSEQARNWWQTPADAETDAHIFPGDVHEAQTKKKGPRIGKSKKSAKYTSAGSVPKKIGRKLSPQQVQNRKAIGDKMLNVLRRGGAAGNKFRDKLNAQLEMREKPTNRLHQYSMIWANASSIAANGGTAADWNVSGNKKKKKSNEEQ